MKSRTRRLWMAGLFGAVLSGCLGAGRPIEFYALTALAPPAVVANGAPSAVVAVLPAAIPAVLDRPQIVTRTGENRLALAEFNRWGGSLREELSRVLVENLGALLAGRGVKVMSDRLAPEPACVVAVSVNRFDGRLGESVWLNADWTLRDPRQKKTLAVKSSALRETVAGPGYAELVAAQSRALAALSREIAAELAAALKTP